MDLEFRVEGLHVLGLGGKALFPRPETLNLSPETLSQVSDFRGLRQFKAWRVSGSLFWAPRTKKPSSQSDNGSLYLALLKVELLTS